LSGGEHQDLQKCSGAGLALVKLKTAIVAFATAEARALSQLIEAFGRAKELGLSPADLDRALLAVNLGGGDANACRNGQGEPIVCECPKRRKSASLLPEVTTHPNMKHHKADNFWQSEEYRRFHAEISLFLRYIR
jgi:hypothetical protein